MGNTLYINGKTELVIKQALLNYAYGGSFNGIIEGTCSSRLEKGQVSAILALAVVAIGFMGIVDWKLLAGRSKIMRWQAAIKIDD